MNVSDMHCQVLGCVLGKPLRQVALALGACGSERGELCRQPQLTFEMGWQQNLECWGVQRMGTHLDLGRNDT